MLYPDGYYIYYIYMAGIDLELWQAALTGNTKAWAELIRRYEALVYTVAIRAGLSMEDAADCFQATWVALFRNRRAVKEPNRLSAWLVTTARREALRLRKSNRLRVQEAKQGEEVDPTPFPDEELVRLERQAHLEIALGELKPRCRQLMELFFFSNEDRTYEQIAELMGVEANSLGPMRRRCLARLKKILVDQGFL